MYTHERYIVLIPFIMLIIVFSDIHTFNRNQKVKLCLVAFITLIIPFIIKKYIYSLPIYMGTGYSTITFSFSSSMLLFIQSVLSVFEINIGPDYLAGIQYSTLPSLIRILVILIDTSFIALFSLYMIKAIKSYFTNKIINAYFHAFIFMGILFIFLLIPGIVQIRLELRWYQASLCVMLVMFSIAITRLYSNNNITKKSILTLFVFIFLVTDFSYLTNGAQNLYFSQTARVCGVFYKALQSGIIKPSTTKLYIWEKKRNPDRENEINWALAGGYFFNFYTSKNKEIIYVDSLLIKNDSLKRSNIIDFDKNTNQILYIDIINIGVSFDYSLKDITPQFLSDSLKNFKG